MSENTLPFSELIDEIIQLYPQRTLLNKRNLQLRLIDVLKYHLINIFELNKYIFSNGIFQTCYSEIIEQIVKRKIETTLSQELTTVVQAIVNTSNSFIDEISLNFDRDSTELKKKFGISTDVYIKEVDFLGDNHNGRCVSLLKLSDGNLLVYRPTNVSCYEILSYYIDCTMQDTIGLPTILNKNSYCWVEYIEVEYPERLNDYAFCAGNLLALCQVLGIEDMHFQNIRYSKGKFYILDFETAFGNLEAYNKKIIVYDKNISLDKTPLFTSLLPIWSKGIFGGLIDNSGLFGSNGLNYKTVSFSDIGHSEIAMQTSEKTFFANNNINKQLLIEGYENGLQKLHSGYIFMESFLSTHKVNISRRKIYRSTSEYFGIREIYYQDISKKTSTLGLLERTLKINHKIPSEIIQDESNALMKGDIPYFEENISCEQILTSVSERLLYLKDNISISINLISFTIDSLGWDVEEIEKNYRQHGIAAMGADGSN